MGCVTSPRFTAAEKVQVTYYLPELSNLGRPFELVSIIIVELRELSFDVFIFNEQIRKLAALTILARHYHHRRHKQLPRTLPLSK